MTISVSQSGHRNSTQYWRSTHYSEEPVRMPLNRLGCVHEREEVRKKAMSPCGAHVRQTRDEMQPGRRRGAAMIERRPRSSEVAVNLPELLVRVDDDRDLLCELIGIF